MAGTYPDVPGHRFMYDQDGSILLVAPVSAQAPLTLIDPTLLNDEEDDYYEVLTNSAANSFRELTMVFPEARDVSGIFFRATASAGIGTVTAWYSLDTTDGTDGTWTSMAITNQTALVPNFRNAIQAVSLSAVRGLRVRIVNGTSNTQHRVMQWHVYGTVPVTANPERLEFWQPSANSILDKAGLDFGDMPLGSVRTKQLRVKNLSSTKTASAVVVSANNLTGGPNDPMVTGLEFSLDGTTWGPSVTIGTIAASAISPVVTVRRTVLNSEAVNSRVARVLATPGAFA